MLIGAALNEKYKGRAKEILLAAMDEGLMTLIAGLNVVRFAPSLIIPDDDITAGMALFEKAVAKIVAG